MPFLLQEKELAAAAEKLAECQETIFLLGKQLKALRPQADFIGSPQSPRSQKGEGLNEEPTISGLSLHDADPTKIDTAASPNQKLNLESQMELYEARFCPSDSESNNPTRSPVSSKHRPTRSSIPYPPSSAQTPERHSRGFSRFFSSKGKSGS